MRRYDYNFELGDHLKSLRKKTGMTQEQVAELMDVQPRTVLGWERGIQCRRLRDFHKLLDIYNVSDQVRIDLVMIAYGRR